MLACHAVALCEGGCSLFRKETSNVQPAFAMLRRGRRSTSNVQRPTSNAEPERKARDLIRALRTRRALRPLPKWRKFSPKSEPFSGPLSLYKYETILFRNKETPACVSGNHPDRPGNIHLNICANHYHL